jgi:hypothetical protein
MEVIERVKIALMKKMDEKIQFISPNASQDE